MHLRHSRAFTLIELLAVMGIIALVTGGLGLGGRDRDSRTALAAAQNTLASLLSAARGEAALRQVRVMLVINADSTADGFLRTIHVATESGADTNQWEISDDGASLPRGIFVVPGDVIVDGVEFADPWPSARRSTLQLSAAGSVTGDPENTSGRYLSLTAPLAASGNSAIDGGVKLVLAAGRRTPTTLRFEKPEQVRGLVLSAYGIAIMVNDGPGFDF